jgi:flagellar protein FlbD
MIVLTRLNGPSFALNPDLIERVEANPDTVVVLIGGAKYPIAESVEELLERVRDYRGRVIASAHAAEFPSTPLPASDSASSSSSERVLRILPTPGSEYPASE